MSVQKLLKERDDLNTEFSKVVNAISNFDSYAIRCGDEFFHSIVFKEATRPALFLYKETILNQLEAIDRTLEPIQTLAKEHYATTTI